jgi:hypothetical protein
MKRILELFGPHEIIALVLFLATVLIWAVTLSELLR